MWDDDFDWMSADKEDREETGRRIDSDETRRLLELLPNTQQLPSHEVTDAWQ